MKAKEIRELSAEELAQRIRETRSELTTLRIRHKSTDGIEAPGRLRTMRKDIARMLTVQNVKALEAQV